MDPSFWHRRWNKNEIGFHESEGNHLLKRYFDRWELANNARIFVPLCGKTRDIAWFLSKGIEVVAIELNESAVLALFDELGVKPEVRKKDQLSHYSVPSLDVYVGDFFSLNASIIGEVDGLYDRGALVALPLELRLRYAQHLQEITQKCRQLLIAYEYEQSLFDGPPFSVSAQEVSKHYADSFNIEQLHHNKVEGGFRGQSEVYEAVYRMTPFK